MRRQHPRFACGRTARRPSRHPSAPDLRGARTQGPTCDAHMGPIPVRIRATHVIPLALELWGAASSPEVVGSQATGTCRATLTTGMLPDYLEGRERSPFCKGERRGCQSSNARSALAHMLYRRGASSTAARSSRATNRALGSASRSRSMMRRNQGRKVVTSRKCWSHGVGKHNGVPDALSYLAVAVNACFCCTDVGAALQVDPPCNMQLPEVESGRL